MPLRSVHVIVCVRIHFPWKKEHYSIAWMDHFPNFMSAKPYRQPVRMAPGLVPGLVQVRMLSLREDSVGDNGLQFHK